LPARGARQPPARAPARPAGGRRAGPALHRSRRLRRGRPGGRRDAGRQPAVLQPAHGARLRAQPLHARASRLRAHLSAAGLRHVQARRPLRVGGGRRRARAPRRVPVSGLTDAILVTGGAGFIGCNFVRTALARGVPKVVVLDLRTYAGSLENLRGLDEQRLAFVQGDIADAPLVARVFAEPRPPAAAHLAAESHVDRSIDGPAPFLHTNVMGAFRLLEGARDLLAGVDSADRARFRFVHVSTDEVYGSLGPTGAFREDTPYAPNSPYSASKAAADHLVRAWHETYGLPAIVTNCSNNYGPYQFPEKLIPLVLLNALEGQPLPIYGDGGNVR